MADPKGVRMKGLSTLGMVAIVPPDLGAGIIDVKDLHAKAEADAILRDIPTRVQDDRPQRMYGDWEGIPGQQRPKVSAPHYSDLLSIPLFEFKHHCGLCTADLKCPSHSTPPLSRADIFKAGFDALIVRVEQLKGDLRLAEMDNQLLRNQRDHYEREAKRLQSALDHANERIKKLESDR